MPFWCAINFNSNQADDSRATRPVTRSRLSNKFSMTINGTRAAPYILLDIVIYNWQISSYSLLIRDLIDVQNWTWHQRSRRNMERASHVKLNRVIYMPQWERTKGWSGKNSGALDMTCSKFLQAHSFIEEKRLAQIEDRRVHKPPFLWRAGLKLLNRKHHTAIHHHWTWFLLTLYLNTRI